MPRSKLELQMLAQLKSAGLTGGMAQEHRFHDERRWRWDFAWPSKLIALEVQGGIFSGGRHARPRGIINDYDKWSEAAILGWRLVLVTGVEISNGQALDRIERALSDDGPPCPRCEDWTIG